MPVHLHQSLRSLFAAGCQLRAQFLFYFNTVTLAYRWRHLVLTVQNDKKGYLASMTLGAIGVVYGDIGTSVLYSMKAVFGSRHVAFTTEKVYGRLLRCVWTLTILCSLQ